MSTGLEGPRATLNELKWRWDALDEAVIYFEDRAIERPARASGADIVDLGRSFITLRRDFGEVRLPYHRVQLIERDGEVVFDRDEMGGKAGRHPEPG